MAWPEKRLVLHGAAFTAPEQSAGFLSGFAAPKDSNLHIGLLHGEMDPAEARYDPIRKEEIAASGLAYLALGHIHKRTEPLTLRPDSLRLARLSRRDGALTSWEKRASMLVRWTTPARWR